MSSCFWQGDLVRLRAVEPADWETFFAWNQDDEMTRRIDAVWFPQSREAVRRWTEQAAVERPQDDTFRWMIADLNGEVVGDITTHDCNRRCGTFSYGLNIGPEHRRKGYAAEAITIVQRYYFQERRYQKVTIHIHAYNEPSIRLHEKLGFQQEGCVRRAVYTEGRFYDQLIFGQTAEEFAARHPNIR